MTLKTKLQAFSAGVIVSAGVAIVVLTNRTVHGALLRELAFSQAGRIGELAGPLAAGTRARKERAILPLLQQVQARTGARYAFVLDPAGTVLAHTNVVEVGKRYTDPATLAALERDRVGYDAARAAGTAVLDVSLPLREAEEDFLLAGGSGAAAPPVGILRFGAPLAETLGVEARIARAILWIMTGVALAAMAVVTWFNHKVLAPVGHLARGTERLAGGDLGTSVPVTSRDELGALARAFNRMSLQLREEAARRKQLEEQHVRAGRLEAMGLVAAKVAHDVNNMLTIILSYGRIAARRLPPGHEARGAIGQVLDAGERTAAISRQLAAFGGGQVMDLKPLDLNGWLAGAGRLLGKLAGEGVATRVEPQARAGWVRADEGPLMQVATNLVANARDAMNGRGTVTVGTADAVFDGEFIRRHPVARPGRYVDLWVADTGSGMDEATMARIFEPYFTTKPKGKGTGLGLASVHGIVEQSGGYVWAESALGKGTTFHVCLPATEPVVPAAVQRRDAPAAAPGSVTILLVDDEDGVRGAAREALRDGGYVVLEAVNGVDAVRVAEAHPDTIQLLLTDAAMPQVSGFELARRLRARRPGLKVVIMTGFTNQPAVQDEAANLGLTYLGKPFVEEQLLAKVREALDGR